MTDQRQLCTCSTIERVGDERLRIVDGVLHRFSGLPCFNEETLHDVGSSPDALLGNASPETGHPSGAEHASLDPAFDEMTETVERSAESVDSEGASPPADAVTEPRPFARELSPSASEAARKIPVLLTDRETGVSYFLVGADDGKVRWTCKAKGCETSATFDNAEEGFVVIRRHCVEEHPPAPVGSPRPCDLADCSETAAGTVTINVPSIGEAPVQRTLGVCAAHLRLVEGGEITGFALTPEYRS